jgi:GT2 family glycosyltransferase
MKEQPKPVGIVVCMPSRGGNGLDYLTTRRKPEILSGGVSDVTTACLREHLDGYPHVVKVCTEGNVIEARNQLAKEAREYPGDEPYVLWIDDDVWFTGDHVETALGILEDNPDVDMVTALAPHRCAYGDSNAYKLRDQTRAISPIALQHGELARVSYCGFHFVMMRRSLLDRVDSDPFNDQAGMAEDWAFCHRVRSAGGRIVTERSLLVGHYEIEDGLVYFVHRPPTIPNGAYCPLPVPKGHTLRTRHQQRDYGVVVSRYFPNHHKPEVNAA